MKKLLLTLTVLCSLPIATWAQPSATLYGVLDMGYGTTNGGGFEKKLGNDSKFQQLGNARTTSRFGIKGSEDLDNGLKIYFQLEQGLNLESGAGTGSGFERVSIVGISGKFGSIQAGRQGTIISNVLHPFNISGGPNVESSLGNAGISALSQSNGRTRSYDPLTGAVIPGSASGNANYTRYSSALAFFTPEFYGIQFQATVILKNDDIYSKNGSIGTLGNAIKGKNIYTFGGTYRHGDFKIAAAYESKFYDIPGVDIGASWGAAASYNFKSFVLAGGYFDNHYKSDGRGFYLGVKVPVNAFELGAQVAYNVKAYVGIDEVKPLAWELFARYNLSKRTLLYAGYGGINNDAKAYQAALRNYSFSLGVTHSF